MQRCAVTATRIDGHGTRMSCKEASLVADTDPAGRVDAFTPAELLPAAVAACMIKGIERVMPALGLSLRGVTITLDAERQDVITSELLDTIPGYEAIGGHDRR
jgi:uncharacterized OsmC-like protein